MPSDRVVSASMSFQFDVDTAVEREGENLFHARITDRWNTFAGPNGGYVLATATRALSEVLPLPHPFAVNAHFLRPPRPGDAEIATEPIRAGRRHATGEARLSQDGKPILVVLATFADLANTEGRELVLAESPALPAPDEAVDPMASMDSSVIPPIAHRMDLRVGEMPGFTRGEPSGRPEFTAWMRFADGREPDPLSLVYFTDGMVPTVFEIGELVSSTVEMTVYVRTLPAPGWLAMRVRTRHVIGGYHEEDAELWDSTGNLVAQSRQLALLGS
jgi:acyl-CoA thioesterase